VKSRGYTPEEYGTVIRSLSHRRVQTSWVPRALTILAAAERRGSFRSRHDAPRGRGPHADLRSARDPTCHPYHEQVRKTVSSE